MPERDANTAEPRVLVITPTYDEATNLERFVEAVSLVLPDAHILVVDDASPDGTGAIADRLATNDPRIRVIHRSAKLGLGTAYVEGFRYALAHRYDIVFEMDADLSHNPTHLPSFLAAIREGADVVAGSRAVRGGGVEGWGIGRTTLSRGGSLYSRLVLGSPVRDMTTGYKAYTRNALELLEFETLQSNGYSFQIETTHRAITRGLRVVEVPILFVDRRAGQSKMNQRIFVEAIGVVWRLRLGVGKRKQNDRDS